MFARHRGDQPVTFAAGAEGDAPCPCASRAAGLGPSIACEPSYQSLVDEVGEDLRRGPGHLRDTVAMTLQPATEALTDALRLLEFEEPIGVLLKEIEALVDAAGRPSARREIARLRAPRSSRFAESSTGT